MQGDLLIQEGKSVFTKAVHFEVFGLQVQVVAPSNARVECVMQSNESSTLNLDGAEICLVECSERTGRVWATGCARDVRFFVGLGSDAKHAKLVLVRNGTTFHITCSSRGLTFVNVEHPDSIANL